MVASLTKINLKIIEKWIIKYKLTWRETVSLLLRVELNVDGSWIWALVNGWMILFDSDETEAVCKEVNTDDVFIVMFWPIFKWTLSAAAISDRVSVTWLAIVFAYFDRQ